MGSTQLHTASVITISFLFLIIVLRLHKKDLLSFRYTIGWLMLFLFTFILGIFLQNVGPLAEFFKIDIFTLLASIAGTLFIAICVQLSISISGMQRQILLLSEELAIQQARQEHSTQC